MALIPCPECGKEVSDKVKACPYCGYPLVDEKEEVGGISKETAQPSVDKHKTPKLLIIGIVSIIALLIVAVLYALNLKKEKDYADNLRRISETMIMTASTSENILDTVGQIWYNAIYEKRSPATNPYTIKNGRFVKDFNDALSNYYISYSARGAIETIKTHQSDVQELMQELQDPPKKYQDTYETVKELYLAYQSLTNYAISPSGSLNTFAQNKIEKLERFSELFKKLQLEIQ